jgi:hypothetical protein
VPKKFEAEGTLENCRALINQIDSDLSGEASFVNVSSAAELLFHLEVAASFFKKALVDQDRQPLNYRCH